MPDSPVRVPPLCVHEGIPRRRLQGVRCLTPSRAQLPRTPSETTARTTMVVAKSQRGIKAGSKPQQNEVQWQRARAETLRTEERSVRMHKERLAT